MRKLFSLLAVATVLMILVTGFGIYWISNSEIDKAKQDSAVAEAKSVALGLSAQINLLDKSLDKMAQDPEVLSAILIGDNDLLNKTAAKLEKYLPDILKLRLLLPGIDEVDELSKPRMGFADLDLVRETLKSNQFPSIQGDKGVDRHLAIARGIMQNGKVIGVMLASLDEEVILKNLRLAPIKNGYYELKQGTLVLGTFGQKAGIEDVEAKQINVANTDWSIYYQSSNTINLGNVSLILSVILVPALIMLMIIFAGNQWLSNTLTQDLECLMRAFKNIMSNSSPSNYPVELTEMNAAISNLMQFKRILDYGDKDTLSTAPDQESNIIVSDDENFDFDDFFEDSDDFKL